MKFLILNGPNLNFLGIREPEIYGRQTYEDLCALVKNHCEKVGVEPVLYQSNHEGDLVDKIQWCYGKIHGIVFNPAAYTHTSVAILDAVKSVGIPTVEVHISDVSTREDFRQTSYIRTAAIDTIMGKGFEGYNIAVDILLKHLGEKT